MKRYLPFILLSALLLSIFSLGNATTVTIGDGTGKNYDPFNTYWGYGRSLGLYTADQIGDSGLISSLGWSVGTACNAPVPYKIYASTTTDAILTQITWSDFTSTAVLLKEGIYAFNTTGWHTFTLDTPFVYTGGNLLIGVEANYGGGGSGWGNAPEFHRTSGYEGIHQCWRVDHNPPLGEGTLNALLPNLQLEIAPLSDEPMFILGPSTYDFGSILIDTTAAKSFRIMNAGGGTLNVTGISPTSDGFFSVTDAPDFPVTLATAEAVTFNIQYAPTAAGNHTAAFTVSHAGGAANVTVFGECYDPVIHDFPWVEDFTAEDFPPAEWARYRGLYPSEPLEPIAVRWTRGDFANISDPANPSARVNIYSSTTKHWLVSPPLAIPAGNYQLDFDLALTKKYGVADPVTPGQQSDDKFMVLIADNATMVDATVLREWNNAGSPYVYDDIATTGEYQALDLSSHTGVRYIAFYGESTASGGNNYLFVDNVRVRETPTAPIFAYTPAAIDFGFLFFNAGSDPVNVTISNTGVGVLTLNASDLSIIGPNAESFAFDASNLPANLAVGQSVNIPVTVTGSTEGPVSATLRMTYAGTDYDVALSAQVFPAGILTIGEGETYTNNYTYPAVYGGWNKNAREQYIVTATELIAAGAQAGVINTIGFNVQHPNTCGSLPDFTISMGTADATEFVDTNFITGLTEVFTADSYTPIAGWNGYTLTTPYYWDGVSNLVIQTSFAMKSTFTANTSTFYTSTEPAYRALYYANDYTAWDTVDRGNLSYNRPNMILNLYEVPAIPPVAPILITPADATVGLPRAGFDLVWRPDVPAGGVPELYGVYISDSPDPLEVFDGSYWETANTRFNPVTEGGFTFEYSQRYYWTVVAILGPDESIAEARFFEIEADPAIVAYPWTEDFDSVVVGEMPANWTIITSNIGDDSRPWNAAPSFGAHTAPNAAVVTYHNEYPKDEWMITLPFNMQAGQGYNISFALLAEGWMTEGEALALHWGTEPTVAAMTTNPPLYDNNQIFYDDWTIESVMFVAPNTGTYYFGWHAYTPADVFYIAVDTITITEALAVDLAAVSLSGDTFGNLGTAVNQTVSVTNRGYNAQSGYTVYIKEQGTDNVLAQLQINDTINPNELKEHHLSWNPTAAGTVTVYAEVEIAGDQDGSNDVTSTLEVNVYDANVKFLYVGDPASGWSSWAYPFNFYYADFVTETIYLASEIQAMSGEIQALAYYNDFGTAQTAPVQIWMKNTDAPNVSSTWLTWDGYQPVFDGNIVCPAGRNEILITLETPFSYTGGNLAIRTSRSWDENWVSGNVWLYTPDPNYPGRTRYLYEDSFDELNHMNPVGGSSIYNVPNITFIMATDNMVETLVAPVADVTLSGTEAALAWEIIPYAYSYNVYAAEDPYNFGSEPAQTVYTNTATLPATADKSFYKVTANSYRDYGRSQIVLRNQGRKKTRIAEDNLIRRKAQRFTK